MPLQSGEYKRKIAARRGAGRSAEDYGLDGLDDATLQELASNPGKYGEKSGLARQVLASRQSDLRQANTYKAALEKAAYGDAGRAYGQGLGDISNYLAGAGPLADSGAATALKTRLAGQIYGQAAGRVGNEYAGYLGNVLNSSRDYYRQRQLMAYQQRLNRPKPWEYVAGAAGGIAGSFAGGGGRSSYGGGSGYGVGSKFGEDY